MLTKLSREEAIRFLLNAPPEKAFWVNNGPVLKSIIELATAAKKLTQQQFTHHVNSAKNDFAKWVDEIIRDSELAKQLRRIKSKDELAHIVTNRLRQLQKLLK
ncbi:hypothetical protein HYU16_04040 [Candidatus Woesearchaeota archaeon]|nr:hypothetical protein [Candidatus Woesearchaeota archaeon]